MVVGLLWMGGILIAMGWFAIGWVARGQENRKYAENRLRYLADQAIEDHWEFVEARARWEAQRAPQQSPTVVKVFMASPSATAPGLSVIDGEVLPSLPRAEQKAIAPWPRPVQLG